MQAAQGGGEPARQGGEVVGSAVGEPLLRLRPHALIGIELRGIGREELEVQARAAAAQAVERLALVDVVVVPKDDDLAAQVTEHVPHECHDFGALDVLAVPAEVEANAVTHRAQRDARDHRDPVVAIVMRDPGRVTARRPGLAHGGDQPEPRLVDEDEVGAQPPGFFLTCGQRVRFQRSMRASSRSSARRSGFW